MSAPEPDRVIAALEATWPPASIRNLGPWRLRDGAGGGKRVSAASAVAPVTGADIDQAEAAMRAAGQAPLFRLRAAEQGLDAMLAARGYALLDPTQICALPVATMAGQPVQRMSALLVWPPLARMRDLWAEAGITAPRQEVMARVAGPKTAIFARHADRPAGVAFVAGYQGIVMLHAMEVVEDLRRQGVGTNMLRLACHWAQDNGMTHMALAVTRANRGANALYASLGMQVVENYHYRALEV